MRGVLVTVEGVEGSGKTTQCVRLAEHFRRRQRPVVLDIEPAAGMRRIGGRRLDAFERMDLAFHQRVREGYLEMARAEKNRVVVLRADQAPDALSAELARAVGERLDRLDR